MQSYEVNGSTYAIIPQENDQSLIIEENESFIVENSPSKIINESCKNFGSSLFGRQEGTKKLINVSYKAPIIICESNDMIFFPTSSPRFNDCIWISLNNIKNYYKRNDDTIIEFLNEKTLKLNISFYILENQIFKATMLASKLLKIKQGK